MQGVSHYENFPVASWLCPAHLRPAIAAIYHFARSADDLADEGNDSPDQRLLRLGNYRAALRYTVNHPGLPLESAPDADRWEPAWTGLFSALSVALQQHHLPPQLLFDLLDAFEQDVRYTASGQRYRNLDELLDYCSRSANPVGRLLLHLYGVTETESLRQSDHICTALQLINFWQDLRQDLARQRHYLPSDLLAQFGVPEDWFLRAASPDGRKLPSEATETDATNDGAARNLMRHLVQDARARMEAGAPLALRIPGRAGWELRLVVQGGLRILEKIEFHDHRCWLHRPKLRTADVACMLWRASRMPAALAEAPAPRPNRSTH